MPSPAPPSAAARARTDGAPACRRTKGHPTPTAARAAPPPRLRADHAAASPGCACSACRRSNRQSTARLRPARPLALSGGAAGRRPAAPRTRTRPHGEGRAHPWVASAAGTAPRPLVQGPRLEKRMKAPASRPSRPSCWPTAVGRQASGTCSSRTPTRRSACRSHQTARARRREAKRVRAARARVRA
eukprot:1000521-Prymnesium_polylepis.1